MVANVSVLSGWGHPIVVPYPTQSIADQVLEASIIVLAKESSVKPFTYTAHTALRGSLEDAREIDLFIDSSTRRLPEKIPGEEYGPASP